MAVFDRLHGDGVYQVTQGDARLAFALEANQNRFRHVQRHNAGSGSKGYQARARGEGDAHGETGMGVTTGTDSVRQQHAVQPGVDDAVTRTQGHTATVHDEVGQGVLGFHVNRLGVSSGVTERLHHEVCLETQASEIFQFITGHRASGVLGTHGGHLRLAVHAGANAVQAAGLADHLLGQGEALVGVARLFRLAEQFGRCQTQGFASLCGQAAADDQVDTAASANFVQQYLGA